MITAHWIKAPTTVAVAIVSAVPPAPAMATGSGRYCRSDCSREHEGSEAGEQRSVNG
jgi:hypothetical protein